MKSTNPNIKIHKKNLNGKLHKINSLKRLLKLTKPHINKIILAALCVMIVNAAELLKPYILKLVIDDFLIKKVSQNGMYSITSTWEYYILCLRLLGGYPLLPK